jgi:hypothetical protein
MAAEPCPSPPLLNDSVANQDAPRKGTGQAHHDAGDREKSGDQETAQVSKTDPNIPLTERRLLSVRGMCGYLSLGDDTIRTMGTGVLASARVTVPGAGGGKVLFDRLLVDQIVAGWRTSA